MAINTEATLEIEETRKVLHDFVIRSVHKYTLFITAQGDTKFRDALVDSIKGLDWITYQATVVSNSRFQIVQRLDLEKYKLPSFKIPDSSSF